MAVIIREFNGTDADYRAFADIRNAEMRGIARPPRAWREFDETVVAAGRDPRRFFLVDGTVPVGYASRYEPLLFPAPGRMSVEGALTPSHRGRGLGRRLFDHLIAEGQARGAHEWFAMVSEELETGCRFLERRGFVERDREIELWMDLAQPPLDDLAGRLDRLAEEGIQIATLESLKAEVPDWRDRLYDLSMATIHDVPSIFKLRELDRETFRRLEVDTEEAQHDAFFLARHGDDWVGMSELRITTEGAPEIHQEYTTTLPDWRRKGVAHALKLHGLAWARQHGYPTIRTMCTASNAAMIGLNEKLGYRPGAAWRLFVRNDRQQSE